MFRPVKKKEEEKPKEEVKKPESHSNEKPQQIILKGGGGPRLTSNEITVAGVAIDPRIIRLLTALDIVTVANLLNPHPVSQSGTWNIANLLNPHPVTGSVAISSPLIGGLLNIRALTASDIVTINNLLNPHPVTQLTRTNMLVKPEREDILSLGGVASPSGAGVLIAAGAAGQKIKVYDAGYHALNTTTDGLHCFYFGTTTTLTATRFCSMNKAGVIHKTFVQPRIGTNGQNLYLYSAVAETNMPYDIGYVKE